MENNNYAVEILKYLIMEDKIDVNSYIHILSDKFRRLPMDILKLINKKYIINYYPHLSVEDIIELRLKRISHIQIPYLMNCHPDPILLLDNLNIKYNINYFLSYKKYRNTEFIEKNAEKINFNLIIDENCNEILNNLIIRQNINRMDWKLLTLNYNFTDDFALEMISNLYTPFLPLMKVSEDFYKEHLDPIYQKFKESQTVEIIEEETTDKQSYNEILKQMGYYRQDIDNHLESLVKAWITEDSSSDSSE